MSYKTAVRILEKEGIYETIQNAAKCFEVKIGVIAVILRLAVISRAPSSPIDEMLQLIGRDAVAAGISRIIL